LIERCLNSEVITYKNQAKFAFFKNYRGPTHKCQAWKRFLFGGGKKNGMLFFSIAHISEMK